MKIVWSPLAIERVDEIAKYIAQDNYNAALRWVDLIFDQVKQLNSFPKSGRVVPEFGRQQIRELLYKNYRIIYRLDKKTIYILTVCHGKQILPDDDFSE